MNRSLSSWQSFFLAAVVATGFGIAWIIAACASMEALPDSGMHLLPPRATYASLDYYANEPFYECPCDRRRDATCYITLPCSDRDGLRGAVMIGKCDGSMLGHTKLPGPSKSRRFRWFKQGDHTDPYEPPLRSCGPCSDVLLSWFQHTVAQSWTFRRSNSWDAEHFLWRMEEFHDSMIHDVGLRHWYLVPDENRDGAAYFVIFDSASSDLPNGVLVGYIGSNGFTKERPAPEDCFLLPASRLGFDSAALTPAGDGNADTCFLLSGTQVIEVGFLGDRIVRHRLAVKQMEVVGVWVGSPETSVRVIWESSETTPPRTIQLIHANNGDEEFDLLVLRSETEIVVLDLDGTEVTRFAIPEAIRRKTFWFYLLSKTSATTMDTYRSCGKPSRMCRFFWLNSEGGVEDVRSVQLKVGRDSGGFLLSDAWADAIAMPALAVFVPFSLSRKASGYFHLGECPDYPTALAVVFSDGWPALLTLSLLGVALGWICYRRQKRYGQRWTWLWVGFVFLFGLPGWVGYRFHRRWPPLEACPGCNTVAPRDREACCHCGQHFPSPALKGTEIFA